PGDRRADAGRGGAARGRFAPQAGSGEARDVAVAFEAGAPVGAHPVVVDVGGEARLVALDDAAAGVRRGVAAHLAAGAQRRLLVEVEDALGEAEAGRGERTHRADVHDAGGKLVVELLAGKGTDLGTGAALEEAQLAGAGDLLGEADAARALDA